MKKKQLALTLAVFLLLLTAPKEVFAMHIMDGFLPPLWAIIWSVISAPIVIIGVRKLPKALKGSKDAKLLLGLVGGFAFVLSALKIPSLTGSCSHPTGVGLGAIIFGPWIMAVVGTVVLVFQALLLAHGGITTLGANVFSMAIVGPFVAFYTYKALKKVNMSVAVFAAAFLGDLLTYVVTALQLAIAFPSESGGVLASLTKFISVLAVTQIPLAIIEGIITMLVYQLIVSYQEQGVVSLNEINI